MGEIVRRGRDQGPFAEVSSAPRVRQSPADLVEAHGRGRLSLTQPIRLAKGRLGGPGSATASGHQRATSLVRAARRQRTCKAFRTPVSGKAGRSSGAAVTRSRRHWK